VGALKFIHEKFSNAGQSPFRIFAGSSCGALNTTFFATESFDALQKRLQLEELWMHFDVPAYYGSVFKNFLKACYAQWRAKHHQLNRSWSILDPVPMQKIMEKGFNRENLERSLKSKSTLGIGVAATELLSGRSCWFQEGHAAKSWNLFHSQGIPDKISVQHLAASCSVPIFLPPVQIHDHYYLDGSVSLSKPLSAAVIMGASRILAIATDKPFPPRLPNYLPGFKPRFTTVVGMLLNRLSHDAALDEAVEIDVFNRFSRALSRRARREKSETIPLFHAEARPGHYQPVEIFMLVPSRRIRASSGMADENGQTGRRRTRFMFHEKFIREMIALGYEDAKLRQDDLKNFFHPETRRVRRWFFLNRRTGA
jgi:NTE family protein